MKKLATIILLVCLFSLRVFAQSGETQAKALFDKGKYDDAAQLYDLTASLSGDTAEKARLYDLAKKSRTCLELLNSANASFKAEKWEAAEKKYKSLLAKENNPKDPTAIKRVAEIRQMLAERERLALVLAEADEAWNDVNKESISELEKFISKYGESPYVETANEELKRARDRSIWENVNKNSIPALESFLARNPNSAYAEEARSRQSDLLEQEAWNRVTASGSKDDYQAYLKQYPGGKHSSEAISALKHWDETLAWRGYLETDTFQGYSEYLRRYPKGIFVKDANQRIELFIDEGDWANAQITNTLLSYTNYVNKHKNGKHVQEAQQRKNQINAENQRKWEAEQEELNLAQKIKANPTLKDIALFESQYPESKQIDELYDAYAISLCQSVNSNTKKEVFETARSYARTSYALGTIAGKEREWKEAKKNKSGKAIGKAIGYTVGGGLILGVLVYDEVRKKAAE